MVVIASGYMCPEGSSMKTMGGTQGDRLGGMGRALDVMGQVTSPVVTGIFVIGRG